MQGPAPIPVFRPAYLTDGLEFQGNLVESPANVFYQSVKASRATIASTGAGRMQFQWRSVSDSLLMSPTVMLRFKLRITCPVVWNQVMQYIQVRGVRAAHGDTEAAVYAAGVGNSKPVAPAAICFADGDAFTSCCSAINLNFNGTSLSLNRTNYFWRDYVRTQISSDDAARIYKSAGGAYDKNDAVGVCVPTYVVGGGTTTAVDTAAEWQGGIQAGVTVDSGIAERCKALYALLEPTQGDLGGARILQVSYPVPVAPFNPWRGYSVPATSPYKSTPLAIPHLSAGGLDFLIEDFQSAFLRRMGMCGVSRDAGLAAAVAVAVPAGGAAGGGPYNTAYGGGTNPAAVGIELVDNSAELELKYFRLSHTRALKESYRFNVWQAQTFLGPLPPLDSEGHVNEGAQGKGRMICIGKDSTTSTGPGSSTIEYNEQNKTWNVQFPTINLAQVPSFLLISAPRLNDEYILGGATTYGAADKYTAANAIRNKSANLYIKSIKLQVNNAQGHIDKVGTDNEAFVLAERLFEMTRENAGSHYFKEGGFRAWRDSNMAVLLSSAQFAPGLGVSDGVAYPVNIDIKLELQNRHTDVSALALQGSACHQVVGDLIRAQAQATAIFTKIILSTTETSATTNAMNFALDSAERLLNQAGSQR
jgi:hypothetical protein